MIHVVLTIFISLCWKTKFLYSPAKLQAQERP